MKKLSVLSLAAAALSSVCPAENASPQKVLVAYYSYSGNTRCAAEQIQKATNSALFEIEPVKPYPSIYKECTNQALNDIHAGRSPELKGRVIDFNQYEVIYVGTPNWWSTIAPPVATFLTSYDFSGKTIIPFVTHGGGGMANCERDMKKLTSGKAIFLKGRAFAGSGIQSSGEAVFRWAQSVLPSRK